MNCLFILPLIIAQLFSVEHGEPKANFYLSDNDNKINVEMEFNQKDFHFAFTNEGSIKYSNKTEQNKLISTYLKEHLYFEINGKEMPLKLVSIINDSAHFKIKGKISKIKKPIKKVYLKNTCLIYEIKNQENIIITNINGKIENSSLGRYFKTMTVKY